MNDDTNGSDQGTNSAPGKQRGKGRSRSDELRDALAHPLMVKDYILRTAPINELLVNLRRAVMLREQGCCFTATSGYGKTYGLALAEGELRRLFRDVPIYRHLTQNQQQPSIRAFFKHFLITIGETNTKGETPDLRTRLTNNLIDAGRASPLKLMVFLIDEAQGMALQDFNFLKDIGNDLEKLGVQLVVVMMGQEPDFSNVVSLLRRANRVDLVTRFALRRMRFRGLSTKKDFGELLALIDDQIYPAGTTCTWPQFFVPNAWAAGFRMKDQVDRLVGALETLLPDGGLAHGVSARQLFVAIRRFIVEIADLEKQGRAFPDDLWDMAVQYALIQDAAEIAAQDRRKGKNSGKKGNWEADL
jgi:hypothetical protein